MTLAEFLPANLFAVMIVFVRTGAAFMLLPGFGDLYVPKRYRLLLALVFSGLIASALAPILPAQPDSPSQLAVMILGEILIGFFLGTTARILIGTLETAGMLISFQLGLSAAQVFNPALSQQSAIASSFLTVLGTLLILVTNTHYLLLRGIVGSYDLFPPGIFPAVEDLSNSISRIVAISFQLAAELAAPLIVIGTVFFVAMGLLARLMPQLQVFFVTLPVQIAGGLAVFAFTLFAIMHWYLDAFTQALSGILIY
ncbi:MAG: flagellar biosynthetic protein FliR [Alphaproteobacteria bacterium]|nr:flagellar biosynthetic protein FliR [Alphaproteobacteria bacterium]